MTRVLTESQAQADFSQMIADACNGEEIIITPNSAPAVRLTLVAKSADEEEQQRQRLIQQRTNAIAAIKAHRKNRQQPAASIEEIIAWRDEGRK